MPKLTLTDLTNLNNEITVVNTINGNHSAIETALENTLSRDGTAPNAMEASLDMNSNRILNLPAASGSGEPVRKAEFDLQKAEVQVLVDEAEGHANAAASSAADATTKAGIANAAAAQATDAANSALALLDNFDDIYLGAKASPPIVDNDGDALTVGDLYFNTGENQLYIWTGSAWSAQLGSETTAVLTNKTINLSNNTLTGTLAQFNTALSDANFVSIAGSETLTNKTLTSPVISTISNTGTLTLPTSTDTLVGRATTDTLTNKSVNLTNNTLTGTTAQFNAALSDNDFATLAGSETLTNKTLTTPVISSISNTGTLTLPSSTDTLVGRATTDTLTNKTVNLTSNTLSGTTAQFNTALSDNDFATQAGSETLTNKTINLTNNTLSGTTAQFNSALSDNDFATLAGSETLTNKTLTSPNITTDIRPSVNDGASLGVSGTAFSDLFLANGGVINWNTGGVDITQVSGGLQFNSTGSAILNIRGAGNAGIELGRVDGTSSTPYIDFHSGATVVDYDARIIASGGTGSSGAGSVRTIMADFSPNTNDGTSLGTSTQNWSDLFLANGAVVNFNDGDVTLTHSTDTLTVAGGNVSLGTSASLTTGSIELGNLSDTTLSRASAGRVAIEGVNVVTVSSTDTLTNKTLTSPTLTTPVLGTPSSGTLTNCTGLPTAGLVDDAVTNAKLANMATATFKGRTTAGTGDPEDLTATQATALLNVMVGDSGSGGTKGLVPAPVAGDATKFFRGDGTFVAVPGGGDALTSNPLSQFAATTSAQLRGVLSDETGGGLAVFADQPTINNPTLASQTTTLPALKFTQAALQTTPAAGDMEASANGFFGTIDAGNRGYIPIRHFIRADATRTFVSNTNPQAIFDNPANGTLTIGVGTYRFECLVAMTSMSATSGNALFDFLGAGTATVADILYHVVGVDGIKNTTGVAQSGSWSDTAGTAQNALLAATAAQMIMNIRGTFTVTVAGTIIPSLDLTNASAAVVAIGSYFMCERIGGASVVSVGNWS